MQAGDTGPRNGNSQPAAADGSSGRGHAVRPHTADVIIEAWGPTPAACYAEAVSAFVSLFADTTGRPRAETAPFDIGPGRPEDLLVLLLEEVLVHAETEGRVPTDVEIEIRGDHLLGRFAMTPVEGLDLAGSIPKGVSYHFLTFGPTDGTWRCRATVDV